MQNRTFFLLFRPIFGEKLKTAPLKEIGCRSRVVDVVIRCEKAFEFPIIAEKSVSILVKTFFFVLETICFWAEKTFEFPILRLNFGEDLFLFFFFFFWRPPVFGRKKRLNF